MRVYRGLNFPLSTCYCTLLRYKIFHKTSSSLAANEKEVFNFLFCTLIPTPKIYLVVSYGRYLSDNTIYPIKRIFFFGLNLTMFNTHILGISIHMRTLKFRYLYGMLSLFMMVLMGDLGPNVYFYFINFFRLKNSLTPWMDRPNKTYK